MKITVKAIIIAIAFLSALTGVKVMADFIAYEDIEPVIYNELIITAENDYAKNNGGMVKAYNNEIGKTIWKTKIRYMHNLTNMLRKPMQTRIVYVKEIRIENDKLIVTNSEGEEIEIDPFTGKILNVPTVNYLGLIVMIILIILLLMFFALFIKKLTQLASLH